MAHSLSLEFSSTAHSPSPESTSMAYSPSQESTSMFYSPSESTSMAHTPTPPGSFISSTVSMAHSPNTRSSFSSAASMATSISSCNGDYFRVFLIQTAKGLESPSGGYKANISLARYLASRGHTVRQICQPSRGEVDAYIKKVAESGGRDPQHDTRQWHLKTEDGESGTDVRVDNLIMEDGVQIIGLEDEAITMAFGGKENYHNQLTKDTAAYIEHGRLSPRCEDYASFVKEEIAAFAPTHVLFNDGLSMQVTSAAEMPELNACRVAIIHTAEQFPFGPFFNGRTEQCSSPDEYKLLQELDGIWCVSDAVKQYAFEHGRLSTNFYVHHPWTYLTEKDHEMPMHYNNWDKKYVAMINPCTIKGIHIFAKLASLCPQYEFQVYKSWGFTKKIQQQLNTLQNVTLRPPTMDMEAAWQNIKVLLVPSLWFEAWGIVVVEAHLRGIPVISSDAGALSESMLSLEYIVPVNHIRGDRDEEGNYTIPEQNIQPWVNTLNKLMSDRAEYERVSDKVRTTTEQWLRDMDPNAVENWLTDMALRAKRMEI